MGIEQNKQVARFLMRVRDGKVAELREYLDTMLIQQVLLGGD